MSRVRVSVPTLGRPRTPDTAYDERTLWTYYTCFFIFICASFFALMDILCPHCSHKERESPQKQENIVSIDPEHYYKPQNQVSLVQQVKARCDRHAGGKMARCDRTPRGFPRRVATEGSLTNVNPADISMINHVCNPDRHCKPHAPTSLLSLLSLLRMASLVSLVRQVKARCDRHAGGRWLVQTGLPEGFQGALRPRTHSPT